MFRHIIFVMMLGLVLVLSGCAEIDNGQYNAGEGYKGMGFRGGFSLSTPHKAKVTEACWGEANNLTKNDFRADDRARRAYFSQCMLRNGYDSDGRYVGIPPK